MPDLPLWHGKRQQKRTVKGRFLGCLLGGAVGDALGAPVEFMRRSEILKAFGPDGITEYAPAYGSLGTITDDTQMTLFTAEGLIRAHVRLATKGIGPSVPQVVAHAYLRWLMTQGERPAIKDGHKMGDGWLFKQRLLHNRRGPGKTCLSALKAMKSIGEPARNDGKGCGGVMRMAPLGLKFYSGNAQSAQTVFDYGIELAALTHGHPTGQFPAGVLAVLILALTSGVSLREGLLAAKALLINKERHEETLRAIETAEELASSSLPPHEAIGNLGQGWVAEEALAISIYCALVARTFRQGVILSVNHDGDSDSTGSITGNLLGAMYGVKAIPAAWLEPLELREVIAEVAEDLYDAPGWRIWDRLVRVGGDRLEVHSGEDIDRIWEKYPGW